MLVNCIGSVLWKKGEFEREGFEKIININLTGAMQLCTEFFPLLEASKGNIVSLDSVVSIRPAPANPAYSASKAGLVQLTKTLAMKWAVSESASKRYMNGFDPALRKSAKDKG